MNAPTTRASAAITERSTQFATFSIERSLPVPPSAVFRAFSDLDAKKRWFGDPGSGEVEHTLDFRHGGREHLAGSSPEAGGSFTYDAEYQDIVPGERIVYTYAMTIGGERISVSVATIDLAATAAGTRLRLTEQGVFLDGLDTAAAREHGTKELLAALAGSLADAAGVQVAVR